MLETEIWRRTTTIVSIKFDDKSRVVEIKRDNLEEESENWIKRFSKSNELQPQCVDSIQRAINYL